MKAETSRSSHLRSWAGLWDQAQFLLLLLIQLVELAQKEKGALIWPRSAPKRWACPGRPEPRLKVAVRVSHEGKSTVPRSKDYR
jgi:hypothetical protein